MRHLKILNAEKGFCRFVVCRFCRICRIRCRVIGVR